MSFWIEEKTTGSRRIELWTCVTCVTTAFLRLQHPFLRGCRGQLTVNPRNTEHDHCIGSVQEGFGQALLVAGKWGVQGRGGDTAHLRGPSVGAKPRSCKGP